MAARWETITGRGTSKCKGPGVGRNLASHSKTLDGSLHFSCRPLASQPLAPWPGPEWNAGTPQQPPTGPTYLSLKPAHAKNTHHAFPLWP